jgi:hypothetical protein
LAAPGFKPVTESKFVKPTHPIFLSHYELVNQQRGITPFGDSVEILAAFSGCFA